MSQKGPGRPGTFPALFLDRDGVINATPRRRYVTRWEEFRFLPGTLRALRRLNEEGRMGRSRRELYRPPEPVSATPYRIKWKVVILSNQAGVGRGILSRSQLALITRRMLAVIRRGGGRVDAVYYCTHAPGNGCRCRKPRTGLLRRACRDLRLDPKRSFVVGDNASDIEMARSAGCRAVLVLSGASNRSDARRMPARPDGICRDLSAALRWISRQGDSPAEQRRK